jgi:hypothetical protein
LEFSTPDENKVERGPNRTPGREIRIRARAFSGEGAAEWAAHAVSIRYDSRNNRRSLPVSATGIALVSPPVSVYGNTRHSPLSSVTPYLPQVQKPQAPLQFACLTQRERRKDFQKTESNVESGWRESIDRHRRDDGNRGCAAGKSSD